MSMPKSALLKLGITIAVPLPAFICRLGSIELSSTTSLFMYGAAVVGAAVLLSWAAETVQLDISGGLAIAILAFIAVLPEYAVDLYFAYTAGSDHSYASYAAANMTGGNQLIQGLGWPLVAFVSALAIYKTRKRFTKNRSTHKTIPATATNEAQKATVAPVVAPPNRNILDGIRLLKKRRIELLFLGIATVYSFFIPILRNINLFDAFVLLFIYFLYLWKVTKEEHEEPELIGVCYHLGCLAQRSRRITVISMFISAAAFILCAAEPFSESLIATGRNLGIDEFLLVQWLAPLVSEAPELIVAGLLAWRLKEDDALGALISSKLNQWTLLVGTIPLAYLVGGGHMGSLPLGERQIEEFILTAAHTLFGFAVLLNLRFNWKEALVMVVLFFAQFPFTHTTARLCFAAFYAFLAAVLIVLHRRYLPITVVYVFKKQSQKQKT